MGRLFTKWFVVSLFIISHSFAADDEWSGSFHAKIHGKLVKKYFSAPKIVKNPPFGWFIELDKKSQTILIDLFNHFSLSEKEIYNHLDLQNIRLLTNQFAIREWARDHCKNQVTLEGEILPPDLLGQELRAFNFTPDVVSPEISEVEKTLACRYLDEHPWEPNDYDWSEDNDQSLVLSDDMPERLVTISGKLHLEIVNNDSELGEIENGGYPIYCWMIKLDPQSFEIVCNTPVRACFQTPKSIRASKKGDELWLTGDFDLEWLCEHINQTVSVQGYLWHAHNAHHLTPVMLNTNPFYEQLPPSDLSFKRNPIDY
jgi:hypothetical protein